jgi:hypothetical protein
LPRQKIVTTVLRQLTTLCAILIIGPQLLAQGASDSLKTSNPEPTPWYKTISLRGYTQIRYNRLFETNPDLGCEQCDRSWGDNGGFFVRRGRMIFSGDVHSRVAIYIQLDFASNIASNSLHGVQIRDAYFDLALDEEREFRIRAGQSKVPYGYENMQSSQNRLPLDRSDALNSTVPNERDLGAFFYWAPKKVRGLYRDLVSRPGKGSGDYGVFAFGIYNGQSANRPELNNDLHIVSRLSYPFQFGKQVLEPGIQAHKGTFTLPSENLSSEVGIRDDRTFTDDRIAATLVLQPRPFGLLAEYNIGRGPEYDPAADSIYVQSLTGGFVTLSYLQKWGKQNIIPFMRAQYYDGGKKAERDARSYKVNEYEFGVEWQFNAAVELTAMYTHSIRRYEDFRTEGNVQEGSLLRLQLQVNY